MKKFEEINLDNLSKGESVTCIVNGLQGCDGSKFDVTYNDNCSVTITRK